MPKPARLGRLLCVTLALHAFPAVGQVSPGDDDIFPPARSAGDRGAPDVPAPLLEASGEGEITPVSDTPPSAETVARPASTGSPVAAPFELPPLAGMLAAFGGKPFGSERNALADAMTGSDPTSVAEKRDRAQAALRFAALHLHHGLWREAGNIALVAEGMAEDLEEAGAERDGLLAEAERIRAVAAVADPFVRAPSAALDDLSTHAGSWPESAALRVAALAREGRWGDIEEPLHASAIMLASISDALLVAIGPHLLETALQRRDVPATEFLSTVIPWTDVEINFAKTWLEGLSAELAGDERAAVTLYESAAEGRDVWAQRARLRAIRLGLENGFIDEEEARERLAIARLVWRGDALAMEVLRVSADLEIARSDEVEAIGILEDMRLRHGDLLDLEAYDVEKWSLVSGYYGEEMTLAQLLEGHSRLAAHFFGQADFLVHAETASDRFLEGGAVQMAADEYAKIVAAYERLSRSRRVSSEDRSGFREESKRVRIKAAEALLISGRAQDAIAMLPETPPDGALGARSDALKAAALTSLGNLEGVLSTRRSDAGPDHLRLLASANAGLERWEEAREGWITAIEAGLADGRQVEAADLHALALASNRSGRMEEDMPRMTELSANAADGVAREDIMSRMAETFRTPEPLTAEDLEIGQERASRTLAAASGKSEAE